jgi:hypothetical protein
MLLALAACDDHLFVPEGGELAPGWCGVEPVLQASCAVGGCHDAATATGGLDLETDALTAMVGVESANYAGQAYVVAGDASSSLLYLKVAGTDAGTRMPLGTPLGATEIAAIQAWIDDGATGCEVAP